MIAHMKMIAHMMMIRMNLIKKIAKINKNKTDNRLINIDSFPTITYKNATKRTKIGTTYKRETGKLNLNNDKKLITIKSQ